MTPKRRGDFVPVRWRGSSGRRRGRRPLCTRTRALEITSSARHPVLELVPCIFKRRHFDQDNQALISDFSLFLAVFSRAVTGADLEFDMDGDGQALVSDISLFLTFYPGSPFA